MACVLRQKGDGGVAARLSEKFGKLWLAAEVILFVLVGAAADIRYTFDAGAAALAMILLALLFRSAGVLPVSYTHLDSAGKRVGGGIDMRHLQTSLLR